MLNTQHNFLFAAALASLLVLSACGNTRSDRAISGAALGAGTGAVAGAVTGGSGVAGAVIGGVAGGVAGAATDSSDVDLGKPVWR